MRTNIDIDEKLMAQAMKVSSLKTKWETVEVALQTMIRLRRQREVLELAGKVDWEGNLDELRKGRFADWQK